MKKYGIKKADLLKEETLIRAKADIYRFLNESGYSINRTNYSSEEYFVSSDKDSKIVVSIKNPNFQRTVDFFSHKAENINDYFIKVVLNNYAIDAISISVDELAEIISVIKELPNRGDNSQFVSLFFKEKICIGNPFRDGILMLIYVDKIKPVNFYYDIMKKKINYDKLLIKHTINNGEVVLIEEYVENYKKHFVKPDKV